MIETPNNNEQNHVLPPVKGYCRLSTPTRFLLIYAGYKFNIILANRKDAKAQRRSYLIWFCNFSK